jgi:uncharacterized membrane protein
MMATRISTVCVLLVLAPFLASAQELIADSVVTMKARVVEVVDSREEPLPGTDVAHTLQTIRVEIIDGPEAGSAVTIENDYLELAVGDVFYLNHVTSDLDGTDYYVPVEKDRTLALVVLALIFIATVVVFGGKQGVRGLIALAASFVFIGLLLSGIMQGYSPVALSIGVASFIVVIGSYVTHGLTRTTSAAVIGMVLTIALTGALAFIAIHFTALTGFSGDETTYLNLNTRGAIDLGGLLLGGILIGLLGVLYDAAIGQAVSVEELLRAAKHYSRKDVYQRALRIGREHVGALVNTLAIAYVGASLPLLLLFFGSGPVDIGLTVNRELFATEIVRILVGSIGLVLAVPITTAVAVQMLHGKELPDSHGHSHGRIEG